MKAKLDPTTLQIGCGFVIANKETNPNTPSDNGGPLTIEEMDKAISQFLNKIIHDLRAKPKCKGFLVLDVDGTFNYRYRGYGMKADMSFYGGQIVIDSMLKLEQLGVEFIALTGAPESSVRVIFDIWIEKRPELIQLKNLLAKFTVLTCYPTDIKGEVLWGYVVQKISQPTKDTHQMTSVQIDFLDDSVRNAGDIIPNQFQQQFKDEGNQLLGQIECIELNSNWLATGYGDYTAFQRGYVKNGSDYSYGSDNHAARERCLKQDKISSSLESTPQMRSYCNEI